MDYHETALERALAADEAKRVLGACKSNACSAGRKPCPTPDACRISIDDSLAPATGLIMGIVMAIGLWMLIVILAAVFWPAT